MGIYQLVRRVFSFSRISLYSTVCGLLHSMWSQGASVSSSRQCGALYKTQDVWHAVKEWAAAAHQQHSLSPWSTAIWSGTTELRFRWQVWMDAWSKESVITYIYDTEEIFLSIPNHIDNCFIRNQLLNCSWISFFRKMAFIWWAKITPWFIFFTFQEVGSTCSRESFPSWMWLSQLDSDPFFGSHGRSG